MTAQASTGITRIEARHGHRLNKLIAKQRAERLTEGLRTMFRPATQWYGDRYVFFVHEGIAKGIGGYVDVLDQEIVVVVDLPPGFGWLKPSVEKEIEEKLAEFLQ